MKRAAILALAFGFGCRPTPADLAKWADKPDGPAKLAHVVHDTSAPPALRAQALTALADFTSHGRSVGVDLALDALEDTAGRAEVVASAAPELARRIDAPRSKDLAYGLLARNYAEGAAKTELRAALLAWTTKDIGERLRGDGQRFTPRAVFVLLGAEATRPLVALFASDNVNEALVASIVMEAGDEATKRDASVAVAAAGRKLASPAWAQRMRPIVEDANKKNHLAPTRAQVDAQVEAYRDHELGRAIAAARIVGGAPAASWLVETIASPTSSANVRSAAVAAAKPNVAAIDGAARDALYAALRSQAGPVVAIAGPPPIADTARMLAAIPEERARLAEALDDDKWFVRRDAGVALLETATSTAELDGILAKLHAAPTRWEIDAYAQAVPRVDGGLA
ncbi:MAG TPA: hypothetical protein VIF62_22440, partial [Labilithrix sp.]